MISDGQSKKNELSYTFSEREIITLAKVFRKCQENIPDDLINFATVIEQEVYKSMSIEEVKRFFL